MSYRYQDYRLAIRTVASSTDERTLIAAVLPPGCFAGNSLTVSETPRDGAELLLVCALLNSFVADYQARLRVTLNVSGYHLCALRLPRLPSKDLTYDALLTRAAHLTYTTPEFDDLAAKVGLGSHKDGVTDPEERAQLRAEIDALVAHLYELTEAEYTHILSTFPLVPEETKAATLVEYRRFRVRDLEAA